MQSQWINIINLYIWYQTIAECTKSMDGPTWNAYQIVGNRARAMCYVTQQNQFRRLTEMAVHELVAAADTQLENLKQMMVRA